MQELYSALSHIKTEADWVGIRQVTDKTSSRVVRNEKVDHSVTSFDHGIMVEVLIDGHFGYAGTSDLSLSGITAAAKKARELALHAAKFKVFPFSTAQRPPTRGQYQSPRLSNLDQISLKEIMDTLMLASQSLNISDKIVNRLAMAMISEIDTKSISSNGSEIHQNFLIINSNFEATAQEGNESQIRSDGGGLARCLQVGTEVFNRELIAAKCARIAQEAIELLNAPNCPNETMDLILAPDQMTLQVHESIGHPLEYDRILGDERNYAGWSFVKPTDFGNLQYGSKIMNVTFDPTLSGEMASYFADDSGNLATKEFLIKDGILQRGLGSLESQARLKLPGVANFRSSSWNRAPLDRMANINIEPGTSSMAEMIAQTEKGMIMHANKSWSIDDYRNKFQFSCEYAQVIKDGKISHTVKNPSYRGITVPFWSSLKAVGKNIEMYGTPYCGKGEPNQVIRVGHATPYCLFSNIEVFGA